METLIITELKKINFFLPNVRKQPTRGVLKTRCSENMQQIYRRTPMPKCDFNKAAKQLYWNTSTWLFSCKFVAYLQNNFFLRLPLDGWFWMFPFDLLENIRNPSVTFWFSDVLGGFKENMGEKGLKLFQIFVKAFSYWEYRKDLQSGDFNCFLSCHNFHGLS